MSARDYHLATERSQMRQLMAYGRPQFEEDWKVAIALAILMSDGKHDYFEKMLQDCFQRMRAYMANNPGELPFEL